MPNGNTASQNIDVLGTRVSSLERDVGALNSKIDLLGNKMDAQLGAILDRIAQSRVPPWQTILAGLSLIVVVFGAVWATGISPIDRAVSGIQSKLDNLASKDDIQYRLDVSGKRRDEQIADLKSTDTKLQTELEAVRRDMREDSAKIVPRGEHERVWTSYDQQLTDKQRQIDDLKKFNSDLVSAPTFMKTLDDRLRNVESRIGSFAAPRQP